MGLLDFLEPVYNALPEVKSPETKNPLKKRILITLLALVLFFVMGRIGLMGLESQSAQYLEQLQTILASETGTLITAGIGPIVLASIILQLLVGGKLIDIDLSKPKDKARFQGLQKLFAVVLCFFEAIVYTLSGLLVPLPGMAWLVILQVAFGSIVLMYLDELVSKHGFGSGIGLFIAGGVISSFVWQIFAPPISWNTSLANGGVIVRFAESLASRPDFVMLLPILIAIIIFIIIVFVEGMHVNIPITMGRTGTGGRFPVKLLYVSNIPVILAVALFANIRLWQLAGQNIPILGGILKILADATTSPFNLFSDIIIGTATMAMILHAIVYLILLTGACVVFGWFWVQMGGQGSEAVADQLDKSGMAIPGFRRDPRIIKGILDRYIPPITILGSIFVGLLAGLGNMTLGTLSSGTGILLTVGIVYRMYEELAREQIIEMHPVLGKIFT